MTSKQLDKSVIYIVMFISTLLLLNLYSTRFAFLGQAIGVIEIFLLYILLLKRDFSTYILLYIVFLITSFEVSLFVSADIGEIFYGFIRLPAVGSYHLFILLVLPICMFLLKGKYSMDFQNHKILKRFILGLFMVYVFSMFSTLLTIFLNDNGILDLPFYREFLIGDIFSHFITVGLVLNLVILLLNNDTFAGNLEKWLLGSLISFSIVAPLSILLGFSGNYGGRDSILLPLSSFFVIILVTFPFYKEYRNKVIFFALGIILLFSMLYLPSPLGGKWWLVLFLVITLIVLTFYKNSKIQKKFITNIFITIILVPVMTLLILSSSVNERDFEEGTLHQLKFEQALQILLIWEDDWFFNLPSSPKFRIDEFVNILLEYSEKPQYLLFGKGLGGSTQHHTNFLNWNNEDAFTLNQIQANVYFDLHETVNVFFLKFGLFGLIFLFSTLFVCIKHAFKNPWLIIGAVWLVFYYSIYFSMLFGMACLILGLYQLKGYPLKNKEYTYENN